MQSFFAHNVSLKGEMSKCPESKQFRVLYQPELALPDSELLKNVCAMSENMKDIDRLKLTESSVANDIVDADQAELHPSEKAIPNCRNC